MTVVTTTDLICLSYVGLTIAKLAQWTLAMQKASAAKSSKVVEYMPSIEIVFKTIDYFVHGGEKSIMTIPRKEFREITDKWIEDYTAKVKKTKGAEPKVFTSLSDAMNAFYLDFCQETSSFLVHWNRNGSKAFVQQPLGLNSLIAFIYFAVLGPFVLLRELAMGGTANHVPCKIAASVSITDVYVVCCKEKISFETALFKYPWVSGIFRGKQIHPMIGRAVCPAYRRQFPFPVTNDTMDFEYDVIDAAMVSLRQRHDSLLSNLLEDLHVSQVVLACTVLYLFYLDLVQGQVTSFSWLQTIAPYATSFYLIRNLVDWQLDITWHPKYRYFL